ncbi:MAG: ABC transporter permease [Candidatus Korarchaeota archaeon]|nr:ABC transporter permease [Candidatus Korarchaeota archaeon]
MDLKLIRADLVSCWAIAKKDLKCYYARPGAILFGVMFPFFMFLSFIVGRNLPIERALPGLTSMVVMFSASSIGPFSIPLERRLKTFDRLLSAPISFYSILAGKVVAGALYGLAVGSVPVVIGILALGASVTRPDLLILSLILSSACFAAMGVMFASFPTEYPGNVTIALNFVRLPMIFVSGVFIPLSGAPLLMKLVSMISPLTYANELTRTAFGLSAILNPIANSLGLLIFTAIFITLGAWLHGRLMEWAEAPRVVKRPTKDAKVDMAKRMRSKQI